MYIYPGRAEPAQRFLGETSTAVTSVPLTKVFGAGVTAMHRFSGNKKPVLVALHASDIDNGANKKLSC